MYMYICILINMVILLYLNFSSCLGNQMGILIFGSSSMMSAGDFLITTTLSYSHPQHIPISGTQPEGN